MDAESLSSLIGAGPNRNPALRPAISDENCCPTRPLTLLVIDVDYFKTAVIHYAGGPRYPHLQRIPGAPNYLDDGILAPLH